MIVFRKRALFHYWGGKFYMLGNILPLIPSHWVYVEPFVGGGSVFFAKTPAKLFSVLNDVNGDVINFYRVLMTDGVELSRLCRATLYARAEYNRANAVLKEGGTAVERAWAFYVCINQGFLGKIGTWGLVKTDDCSLKAWWNGLDNLGVAADLLRGATIECVDALKLIPGYDRENTFFYIDPPYINTNQGHYAGFGLADYERLLELLGGLRGRFLLSGYRSDVLAAAVERNGWGYKEFDAMGGAKDADGLIKKKTEVLVWNYEISGQTGNLFSVY